MGSEALKASVVINTYNRADYLPNAIASIAAQSYRDVELIVVNGPSTDNTDDVLDAVERTGVRFKRATCPNRNLAESRNVGISAAAGDVVLFIDDDAVAHREWVARLMATYYESNVAAAGGFTFDHTGVSFQCRYTVCDKFGNARFYDSIDPETLLKTSADFFFPSLLGTNCSFSRNALERIGGFDEVFAYMLDETDVCARLAALARRVVTVPNAYVFHKYAPSETRTHENLPRSLLAPARSKAYFCCKHWSARGERAVNLEVLSEVERYRKDIEFSNKWFLDHKKISPAHYSRLSRELASGIAEGLRLGVGGPLAAPKFKMPRASDAADATFTPIVPGAPPAGAHEWPLRIYLVSQGYPPADTAGIARWTHECAQGLAAKGHEVHVITRSQSRANHVDFRCGVWVHSVTDAFDEDLTYPSPVAIPSSVARRATAVLREVKRCESIWGVDVVSAPIWDVEGLLCCAHLGRPVVTSLHTTYKLAMRFKPEWKSDLQHKTKHVDRVIAAERWLLEHSPAILANSRQVIAEIDDDYGGVLDRRAARVTTVPHGIGSPVAERLEQTVEPLAPAHSPKTNVLFVGRLEERKGPDQLLSALAHIPNVLDQMEVTFVGSAGRQGDAYSTRLTQMADSIRRKCPRATIRFVGYVSDTDLQRHYADADVFVAPSRYESFGLVLIEAMRHGTPVIACDVGGMREIISDGTEGFLVPVGDVARLADRLRLLVEQKELRATIGEAARQTYELRFTASKMVESLEEMFRSVIEENIDG